MNKPNNPNDTYTSPLASRNASPEMLALWSPRHKFNTWRRIWLAIAQAQHEVTKNDPAPLVTAEQVAELKAVVDRGITDAELARAAELERDLRHDVMAHVHCLGEQCPNAKPIIHLGCTSQDVVCNADLEVLTSAGHLIHQKLFRAVDALASAAERFKRLPTLGFTHYQPAQPTTLGRRCSHWAFDLSLCSKRSGGFLDFINLRLRGLRGATGTQASFENLLPGQVDELEAGFLYYRLEEGWESHPLADHAEYEEQRKNILEYWSERRAVGFMSEDTDRWIQNIERMTIADYRVKQIQDFMYSRTFAVVGQTYPRVIDTFILADLASTAAVLHKIATDIRLLSNRKELDEPFGDKQIGSSAMPYKRNPMKCERICGLTRFVMNLVGNAYDTAATQWLERTLDDSANRRLSLPEAFLALDGALDLMHNVASGLVVNEAMVRKNLMEELPFLATENILMEAVKAGGDRQDLHEKIRVHAQAAGARVKQQGLDNDLIPRLRADPAFASVHHLLTEDQLLDPMQYVGRSVEQTERFIKQVIEPLREQYADDLKNMQSTDRGV